MTVSLAEQIMLDTSVVLHLVRHSELGKKIVNDLTLGARPLTPLISVVSVGEIFVFARRRRWEKAKLDRMEDLLRNLVWVDINSSDVLDRYADIIASVEKGGAKIGQNDAWIAACASVSGAVLVTTDGDFDRLDPQFLRRVLFAAST